MGLDVTRADTDHVHLATINSAVRGEYGFVAIVGVYIKGTSGLHAVLTSQRSRNEIRKFTSENSVI
jgi:hypothetical protein